MPCPFPGMDPWLENSGHWPDFHHRLITRISESLSAQLRPAYFIGIEERAYIVRETDPQLQVLVPDLQVLHSGRVESRFPNASDASLAVAEPVVLATLLDNTVREPFLSIRSLQDQEVVTVIEVLSPSNKTSGAGQRSYDRKRNIVMRSEVHLVELDLLRGEGSFLPPIRTKRSHYTVHVSRATERPDGSVWPITMQQRLPVIPIPLRPEHADAQLDLQAVFSEVYERAGYDLVLNYRKPPKVVLLTGGDAWADGLLRQQGLRSADNV